jgi:hypothetical protein
MRRIPTILPVLLCVAVLSGCGSSSSTSGTATAARSITPAAVQNVVGLFAGAYVRFLDGDQTAMQLPDAAPSVRRLAAEGGQVPPAARRGTLLMVSLIPAPGVPDEWYVGARDLAHTFYATIDVGELAGRAIVTGIGTPDFEQDLAPPGPPPPPPPKGSLPALDAARVFLRGYLPWLYAEGPLGAIHDATPGLLAYLKAHTPRVPLTIQGLHPRVAAIAVQRRGAVWQALPNITDGHETYELVLTLHFVEERWLVSAIANPQ